MREAFSLSGSGVVASWQLVWDTSCASSRMSHAGGTDAAPQIGDYIMNHISGLPKARHAVHV